MSQLNNSSGEVITTGPAMSANIDKLRSIHCSFIFSLSRFHEALRLYTEAGLSD